ncbi:single-stranded DNA-binding protein [Pseudomonas hygromyciniae]|uniref:Single-stranded DNA-binding protein n=1 Tax=Pseudomonas hygromyciniae TaxID=2812000 RepID=A0ABX7JUY0_9PSED|nr:single-stranded DNA-binding protein [Pseudomonas hygromyciniae]QSB39182.1 single-stranded DNA-binding protein [Pseudomonas hygromyciniae]
MARGGKQVILVGTCGQDPEVRYLPNGNAVTNLSLATSEQWTDKQTGQKVEKPNGTVYRCSARLQRSPVNTRQGSQVCIEGKLQTREWEKDGIKRYTTEIVVDMQGTMQLLGGRPQGDQQGQGGMSNRHRAHSSRVHSQASSHSVSRAQRHSRRHRNRLLISTALMTIFPSEEP